MTTFTISIAGIPIRIEALYETTKEFCSEYLTDKEPELTITSGMEKIRQEADLTKEEAEREGKEQGRLGAPYLEQLAIYREIADRLTKRDILLFHASAIAVDGRAYLFAGRSGIGKSTHTRLWQEKLLNHASMVNDDKPLLKITESAILACGTPWNGKEKRGNNIMMPVKAICFLERAEKN